MTSRLGMSTLCFAALGGLAFAPVAMAQTAVPQPAPSTVQNAPSESLSSKLNASGGVIKPTQDVDPGMQKAAPVSGANATSVIPPSATGGQNAK